MCTSRSLCSFLCLLLLPFFSVLVDVGAHNTTTDLSTRWIANGHLNGGIPFQPILLRRPHGTSIVFTCGFYFLIDPQVCYFGIFIAHTMQNLEIDEAINPRVVWHANRNNPISANATLKLTAEGDLVLTDVDGSVAWSTNTTGMSVAGMRLTNTGNLVLFDKNNATVWQSFDHPTDTLVHGQKLRVGQKLIPITSPTNWTGQSVLSLSLTPNGLFAQTETDPPQVYYFVRIDFPDSSNHFNYIEYIKGNLQVFMNSTRTGSVLSPFESSSSYIKFEFDGHLRSHQWDGFKWFVSDNLLIPAHGKCGYPTVCGRYGICNFSGQCSCPRSSNGTSYFEPVNNRDSGLGCVATVPLSCEASQFQTFLELDNYSYFTINSYLQLIPDLANTDKESCRKACANNCSCAAAFFQTGSGSCYLLSQIFSLTHLEQTPNQSIAFIKVQNFAHSLGKRKKSNTHRVIMLSSIVGALIALTALYVVKYFLVLWRQEVDDVEEDYPEQLPGLGLLTRFTYDALRAATGGFSMKLGEGGFGSVFEGTLLDGTKVAVKHLHGVCQMKKSFLAEVETIGNIHHVNLVRLIGLCATKCHRLLVYEYMFNGSLDQWIFPKLKGLLVLDWKRKRKIIYDIAKGLNYLHEECKWKIVHMDIKPQNILLDEDFNAKVADFGLSKLLDRDQSRAETTVRGTPGYMAPEWLSATITEKVDVYSFGVVILEIVCGRKVFDSSQNEENRYLLDVFKRKAEEGRLLDMVDSTSEDLQLNRPHLVNMIRIAAWCLQGDFSKRPSMMMVIKVLDGVKEIPVDLNYDFSHDILNIDVRVGKETANFGATVSVSPSILSGPR